MTWVKICGMTNLEDALTAVDAGADAVGFVFYEQSPRNIRVEAAREIVERLPGSVEKIGVFVGETTKNVNDIAARANLTGVQFYHAKGKSGSEGWTAMVQETRRKLIIAVGGEGLIDGGVFISDETKRRIYAILIDSGSGDRPGGTGATFDWEECSGMVRGLGSTMLVIAAGGLTPENVIEAMGILNPWGVDVASGVEARPGKKDPEKVRAFVSAVREADRKAI
ncbi:MAG: phosphoribosylanthranilate isomerase [Candidatus Sulfotelmatobacter sp.]